ncbi:MAG: 3-deoxy-D-arabino-heptulosonate 7-phosphate synthase [Symploca sp. SIO2D2]|nr:3-deoxy-D-arabino-heptulosonate 7-phosphate synthase [Symploca sp. SIO2D2]
MIIPKEPRLTDEQFKELLAIAEDFGCSVQVIEGALQCIYAIVGDERHELLINRIEGLEYIQRVDTIQSPHKLLDIRSELKNHIVEFGGVKLGQELLLIGGPCTIDPKNPNGYYESAHALKEAGAQALRGGVWKPRTNPYSFQGDSKSLDILMEASRQTGLPVNTEVMDESHLQMALDAGVNMLQVGTRNALNYSLLRQIGQSIAGKDTVVLLKRGRHMGPVNEFISAAEYIVNFGNPNVMLCPRGTLPGLEGYRNHPDESITPLLKERTWAPVVADPSHAVGKATYVEACSLASIAYGADGLCIESHIDPPKGLGDDPKQAITPQAFGKLADKCRAVWDLVRS